MRKGQAGFTLIELMIVIAIIAIIASIAIPNLLSSRLSANETAAIGTLRNISSAQAQCQASGKIDADNDGAGEFGYFGELSGGIGVRGTVNRIDPPMLSGAFRNVSDSVVSRSGYIFRMYLPDAAGLGIPEAATGGTDTSNPPNPNFAETTWACYAWPANFGNSGNRSFFVNQQGDVLATNNLTARYTGSPTGGTIPTPDAAYDPAGTTANSIVGFLAIGITAKDGQIWNVVN